MDCVQSIFFMKRTGLLPWIVGRGGNEIETNVKREKHTGCVCRQHQKPSLELMQPQRSKQPKGSVKVGKNEGINKDLTLFYLPVHPGGAEPDLCLACLGFLVPFEWRPRGAFFLPRSLFFILLPRNPVIPGQLLLMSRGNELRFFFPGQEEEERREQK